MAPKQAPRKAAASAAAHAASKKKSSSVQITANDEALVRDALKGLTVLDQRGGNGKQKRQDAAQVAEVYEVLQNHGFEQEHIRQALQALAGQRISEEAALDWLCLHLDPKDLPRRFAGVSHLRNGAGPVRLVAKADPNAAARRLQMGSPATEWVAPPRPAAPPPPPKEEAPLNKDQQRAWIMRYMEEGSSSEEEQEEAEVEDWELWGDPREIERRKADRKRESLPLHVRKTHLAEEWGLARAEAAKAKAAADKPRQKSAGLLIASLKQEMKQLGVSEGEIEAMAAAMAPQVEPAAVADEEEWPGLGSAPAPAPAATSAPPPSAWDDEEVRPAAPDGAAPPSSSNGGREPPGETSANGRTPGEDEDVQVEGGMGLFDEEEPGVKWEVPQETAEQRGERLMPLGGYAAEKKVNKKLRGRPVEAPAEVKAPKALLQQHCQKRGIPPPRFDKLPLGGQRLEKAGLRYSVTLEPPLPTGPRRKGAARPAPRTFSVPEDDDGWEAIQEAQNAAAAFALFNVAEGPDAAAVAQSLGPPYRELWLRWLGRGPATTDQPETDREERLAFVESLLSQNGQSTAKTSGTQARDDRATVVEETAERKQAQAVPGVSVEASPAQKAESARMLTMLRDFQASEEGQRWQEARSKLPVCEIRAPLLAALQENDVVVVGGDTGCGKTTQVPQYLLEAATVAGAGGQCSIVCTQPRRIAAISVAERVANERGEPAPGEPGARVGYHVRLDAASTRDTRLLFCTTGILLRRMASDPGLASISHVIVDEVHERTLQGDFLMTLLKELVMTRRKDGGIPLKVVLMSATLDSDLFARYYGGCPVLAAGGRTFPVTHFYLEDAYEATGYRLEADSMAALRDGSAGAAKKLLEKASARSAHLIKAGMGDESKDSAPLNKFYDADLYQQFSAATRRNLARVDENRIDYDLLEALVAHIDTEHGEGAILVFLPGMGEISSLYDRLTATKAFRDGKQWVLPLHSSVSPAEQRRAFQRPPPGVRKMVLATNIAETSLTIEDVVYVVDSGKLKERRYDASRGMSLLVEDWVSRASALQRKGRAGRVRAGMCFGLYTRQRFEHRLRKFQAPEMVRVPLEELVLQIHLLRLGPAAQFLERVLEPPPAKSVAAAVSQLQAVGALSPEENLTPLGHHLAQLPVDAKVGKLLLLAATLGCLAPALTIAACLSYRTPFSAPFDQQDAAMHVKLALAAPGSGNIASGQQSDHLLQVAAFNGWVAAFDAGGRGQAQAYARKQMLSWQTLEMLREMRMQFASMLADINFMTALPGMSRRGQTARWADDPKAPWNKHAAQPSVVKAALCAALYPHVAVMDESGKKTGRPKWNDGVGDVFIHPSSIHHMVEANQFLRPYLIYLEKVKTTKTFLRDCTVTSPMALLLFGGTLKVVHDGGYVLVDEWLRIRAPGPTAVLVKKLRAALDQLLQAKIKRPNLEVTAEWAQLLGTIVGLLQNENSGLT